MAAPSSSKSSSSQRIRIPHNWEPRGYQRDLWNYLERGGKRAVAVWHRRAGKDDVALHWTACALTQRVGTYWHMLPQANQARKAIWEAVNPHTGKRRIDEAFPQVLRDATRDAEMFIRFKNGSTWQVVGSDNFNSLVGSPPIGIVFSEYSLADPQAWPYMRPILLENGGWSLFIYTPRGDNHGRTMFIGADGDKDWFAQRLTVKDTNRFTQSDLDKELAELIRENGEDVGQALFDQEYNCSWSAPLIGSYYGREMTRAEQEGRICRVPWEPAVEVHTCWDLGIGDSNSIWFLQRAGREWRWIDYVENSGVGLEWYANEIKRRPYVYGEHLGPHDAEARELQTGLSRVQFLDNLGIRMRVVPRHNVDDGIAAVRNVLAQSWFDKDKCERGIAALRQYRRHYDEKNKVFRPTPLHDWASHGSDAARTGAMGQPKGRTQEWSRDLNYSTKWVT